MTIFKLGGMAKKKDFAGPAIGVKVATKNERNFTDEQLRGGQSIIGLQVQNMTGFLPARQLETIIDSNLAIYAI